MSTVVLRRKRVGTAKHKGKMVSLPEYEVLFNGTPIGTVQREMITRERKTPGNRYVNARWRSPGWRWHTGYGRALECSSRYDGVTRVLVSHGWAWGDAEAAAKGIEVHP